MADKLPTTKEGWDEHIRKNREKKAKEERDRKERVEKDTARRRWVADGGRHPSRHALCGPSPPSPSFRGSS